MNIRSILFCCVISLFSCQLGMHDSLADSGDYTMQPIYHLLFSGDKVRYPFPQHVTYAPESIRPNHRSVAQQDNDVRAAYNSWKTRYLMSVSGDGSEAGVPLYRISYGTVSPGRTVSEGQGYGMVITALMAGYDPEAKKTFDGLWNFSRQYPSSIDSRLMSWQIPEDPDAGADSAFDGDADIAYGLLLADAQWGSKGQINYKNAAQQVITAINESTIGPESHLPMLGDWVMHDTEDEFNQYTPRSSDFMPAHFRTFAAFTGNTAWLQTVMTVRDTITHMQNTFSPDTGLLPDFMVPVSAEDHTLRPAPPSFMEGQQDGSYDYNAGRVPWRIGTDALLYNDPNSREQVQRMVDWIVTATGGDDGTPTQIKDGYTLGGTPTYPDGDFTSFYAAPFGVAAMTTPQHQQFLNAVYDAVVDTREDYYEDTVTLLCLLLMTGNYWSPTP